jgi:TctA family transporter|tara:strand:+ start:781 stop:2229 length:1449 start_codon:yes stop_codon:yes gene_type:complete
MEIFLAIMAGTLYGLIVGIVPSAGATTGLVAMFGFIGWFTAFDPYLGVIFVMAVVASSTTGDSFSGVLLGIPGANSAAATMVDGFPLALQGRATEALTAAIVCSTFNGLLWGTLTFALLPWYSNLIMIFGIPELWAFVMLALATVGFVSSKYWVRSLIAIAIGCFIGLIGMNPETAADRYTFGWDYLADSVQIMPFVAGLFAVPEIVKGLLGSKTVATIQTTQKGQTWKGIKAVWEHKWDGLRGGFIGAFIGFLPGLGGAMSDWMAYGATTAANQNEKIPFGKGNIKGVIGPEGSNNAQKATSMIPTVLFGIPGASFAAIVMALFMYLDFELGTPDLVYDTKFFDSLFIGFMGATIAVCVICLVFIRWIALITYVPYWIFGPLLLAFVTWACVQYTGGWEDYAIFILCSILGLSAKYLKFSRPAMLMGFILADRIESLSLQMFILYDIPKLLDRPIFLSLCVAVIGMFIYGVFFNKSRLNYS